MIADILSALRLSAIALLTVSSCCVTVVTAHAASSGQPAIVAASEIRAVPSSETPLNLRIEAAEAIPAKVVLTVRGVPASVKLTEGRQFGPGVWVVPLNSITRLKLNVLADASGKTELSFALVNLDGTQIAEHKVTLVLGQHPAGQEKRVAFTASLLSPAKPQPLTGADRELALKLKGKGDAGISAGDVLSARPFYQAAADRGLPEAAMALAATYDPDELAKLKSIVGVMPDAAQARKWYEKAQLLGAPEAAEQLRRLAN